VLLSVADPGATATATWIAAVADAAAEYLWCARDLRK